MNEFLLYAQLGLEHITDWKGYDHILFIVALCAGKSITNWRALLITISAFTLGHSLTLALSVLQIVNISPEVIETLIPVTIICTAATHFFISDKAASNVSTLFYIQAAGFGLIHGMGFSNFLRAILTDRTSLVTDLLAFNLGLEIGQLCIVLVLLLLSFVVVRVMRYPASNWRLLLAGTVLGMSFSLLIH